MAGQRLIDRVVHDLVNQMVQTFFTQVPMYMAGRLRTASKPSKKLEYYRPNIPLRVGLGSFPQSYYR